MNSSDDVTKRQQLAEELITIIRNLSDEEAGEFLGQNGILFRLLEAILDASEVRKYPNIAEFLLANKRRAQLIAFLHRGITNNYAFRDTSEEGFVSPSVMQYFDDGVMFLESDKPFEGFVGLYRNGRVTYAISARDARKGEQIGLEHLDFVDMDDFNKIQEQGSLDKIGRLDEPAIKLKGLLDNKNNDESKYQELLQNYPWILGLHYQKISRHENLDDENIPDFTGVRVHDSDRDIFELKPPFMKVFTKGGELSVEFYRAWNQAERYLNFVSREKDYLARKGRRFDNPKCYLILGYNLSEEQSEQFRVKQRITPAIQILTYNDLLAWVQNTINVVRRLKVEDQRDETDTMSIPSYRDTR